MVELKNVCGDYGDSEVIHNINLSFEPGKVTVLAGPNGCGKSTLLKSIIRLNPHTAGEILVEGMKVEEMDSISLAQRVAYLPQGKKPSDITVIRMVLHGRFPYLKYPRRYRHEDFRLARKALEWVGIDHLADKNVSQLSGGTQQKVYIAMALTQDTPTILMDEPTVYLDIAHQMKLMEMAKELAKQGKAVVMVLHDLVQSLRVADKLAVMCDGRVVMCGTPEEIYESGVIDEVFGIHMERMETSCGYQYFYDKVMEDTKDER